MEEKEIIKLPIKEIIELGYCPTCLNRKYHGAIYGDDSLTKLYQDEDIEVILVSNPRSRGHIAIISTEHYKNMLEAPDKLNIKMVECSKFLMNELVKIYGCETVYLCTMCDGKMNHYHVQLIPRYKDEDIGSKNFVKPRKQYVYEEDKFLLLKESLISFYKK